MAHDFLNNLLGRSNSLTLVRRTVGVRRQGNGNFAVTTVSEWADGSKSHADIGLNFRSQGEAKAFAASQIAKAA